MVKENGDMAGYPNNLALAVGNMARRLREWKASAQRWDEVDKAVREHPEARTGCNVQDEAARLVRAHAQLIAAIDEQMKAGARVVKPSERVDAEQHKSPEKGLRDRFTGKTIDGAFILADDVEHDTGCPVCGAMPGQQCSAPDPADDGMGIELGAYVHAERGDSANGGLESLRYSATVAYVGHLHEEVKRVIKDIHEDKWFDWNDPKHNAVFNAAVAAGEALGLLLARLGPWSEQNCAQLGVQPVEKAGDVCRCTGCGGRHADDGCGYQGGESGGVCPNCGGMLLSQKAIAIADEAAKEWERADAEKTEPVIDPIIEAFDRVEQHERAFSASIDSLCAVLSNDGRVRNHPERQTWVDWLIGSHPHVDWCGKMAKVRRMMAKNGISLS